MAGGVCGNRKTMGPALRCAARAQVPKVVVAALDILVKAVRCARGAKKQAFAGGRGASHVCRGNGCRVEKLLEPA